MERRYDIGHGVTIRDNGHSLIAEWKTGEHCSNSIGIHRPQENPTDTVEVQFSRDKQAYYLPKYCQGLRAWLGVPQQTTVPDDGNTNVFGPGYARFKSPSNPDDVYYRVMHSFAYWDLKTGPVEQLSVDDLLVQDYLVCEQNESNQQARRFNKAIEFTGRDLKWILAKIGPWVPIPEEPVIKLLD